MCDARGQNSEAFELLPGQGLLLGAFEICDIHRGNDITGKNAARCEPGSATGQDPSILTVGPAQPVLHARVAALVECGPVAGPRTRQVVRVPLRLPTLASLLFPGPARDSQPDPRSN